jgi:thioesterase domain-containing protein
VAALSRAWGLEIAEDALRSLGGDAAIAHVAEKAAEAKMLPRGYGLEYVQRLFALGLAAVDVCSRFVPKAYRGRVTLLRVQGSPAREEAMPRDYGWGQHTTRPVSVYIVPGDHETMVQRPHIRELAATLRRALRNTSDINV